MTEEIDDILREFAELHNTSKEEVKVEPLPSMRTVPLPPLKFRAKHLIDDGKKDSFTKKNLNFAGYESSPVEDGTLDDYFAVIPIEMNKLVTAACEGLEMSPKFVSRTKNFFALGVLYYMYDRPLEATENWLEKK